MSRFIKRRSQVQRGLYVLLCGEAKVGKSHFAATASQYGYRTLWITAGEGDGFRTAFKVAGEIDIFDVADVMNERRPIDVLREELRALRNSEYDCIVLDSIDGLSRLFEQVIGKTMQRRNKAGAVQLQMQDHGSKKTLITEIIQDLMHELAERRHVIVICGLRREQVKEKNRDEYTTFSIDMSGKSAAELPRYFSAVIWIQRGREHRSIAVTDDQSAISGARLDIPERMTPEDFGMWLLRNDWRPEKKPTLKSESSKSQPDEIRTKREQAPKRERPNRSKRQRPQPKTESEAAKPDIVQLPKKYKLQETDIAFDADFAGCEIDTEGHYISDWHLEAYAYAVRMKRRGEPLTGHDKAVADVVYKSLLDFSERFAHLHMDEAPERPSELIEAVRLNIQNADNRVDCMQDVATKPVRARRYDQ